jgi:putative transposase
LIAVKEMICKHPVGAIQRADAINENINEGIALKDLCRKHGFSEASYYLWRSKYGGMDVSR